MTRKQIKVKRILSKILRFCNKNLNNGKYFVALCDEQGCILTMKLIKNENKWELRFNNQEATIENLPEKIIDWLSYTTSIEIWDDEDWNKNSPEFEHTL